MFSRIILIVSMCSYGIQIHDTKCQFVKRRAVCSNLNLSYIPPIPAGIHNLIFENNKLDAVTKKTFQNITQPETMKYLQLNGNEIDYISSDAFDSFTALFHLNLNFNFIKQPSIGSLKRLVALTELHLNSNQLSWIHFPNMTSLTVLWLNNNVFMHIPSFCLEENISIATKLQRLHLNSNLISALNRNTFKCLHNLRYVQLVDNRITEVENDLFFHTPKIDFISLSSFLRQGVLIHPHAFRSPTLSTLIFGSKGEALNIFTSLTDTFNELPNLKILSIRNINMQRLATEQQLQLFSPLTNLTSFRCYMCHLRGNPQRIFQRKPYLQKIILNSNFIEELTLTSDMSHIKTLLIGDNKFTHVHKVTMPVDILAELRDFDISNNPFTCECNIVWFIDWLSTHKSKLTNHFPSRYRCASPSEMAGKLLTEVQFPYLTCHPSTVAERVGIIVGPIVTAILILSIIIYRSRWDIRHYIYLLRKKKNYVQIQGEDYEYDAFISYTQEDCQWVRYFLLPLLEEELNLKICVHDRDFRAGVFINDNIVECMDKSKRVILVLSNAFANSSWCKFELKVANSLHIEEDIGVMAVVLEKILTRNIDKSMKLLLETTTYLEWTDQNNAGYELFLAKLKDFMGL